LSNTEDQENVRNFQKLIRISKILQTLACPHRRRFESFENGIEHVCVQHFIF
jgi:hypothetical protein